MPKSYVVKVYNKRNEVWETRSNPTVESHAKRVKSRLENVNPHSQYKIVAVRSRG